MDLVRTDTPGAYSQPSRLAREFSALVWETPSWTRPLIASAILAPVLFGATVLIAGVAYPSHTGKLPTFQLEREEFAAPMVQLLDEMRKINISALPAGTQEFNFLIGPTATPFFFQKAGDDRQRAATCLATAGYYEAGNDVAGQRAVMQVVLNRVRHASFPKSVCGVVFQGSERRTGCQFSFTCDGSMTRRIPSARSWAQAKALAEAALSGAVDPTVRQATHFHADYVNPWWAAKLEPITKVGAHIFYRWSGSQGTLDSGRTVTGQEWQPQLTAVSDRIQPGASPVPADATVIKANMIDLPAQPSLGGQTEALRPAGQPGPIRPEVGNPAAASTMLVDSSSPSGRWAVSAMNQCAGTGGCRVIAYDAADPSGSGPLFVFVRDSSGMQLALWDCEAVPRSRQEQCLPQGAELAALLKGR